MNKYVYIYIYTADTPPSRGWQQRTTLLDPCAKWSPVRTAMLRSHVHLWQVQLYSNYGLTHRIHKSDILHFCYMFHLRVYIFKDVYIYIISKCVSPWAPNFSVRFAWKCCSGCERGEQGRCSGHCIGLWRDPSRSLWTYMSHGRMNKYHHKSFKGPKK